LAPAFKMVLSTVVGSKDYFQFLIAAASTKIAMS
jgi:hypothetical protein